MNSSSDDEKEAVTVRSQDRHKTTETEDKDGNVSPRTLHAIQSAMMDDSERHKNRKYVIVSSSEDEENQIVADDERLGGDGGVSPRTLLAIQKALGEGGSFNRDEEQRSISVRETALQSNDHRKDISVLTPDVSLRAASSTPRVLTSRPNDLREPVDVSEDEEKQSASDQKPVNEDVDEDQKEEENRGIVVKTGDEEETSSSEGTNTQHTSNYCCRTP